MSNAKQDVEKLMAESFNFAKKMLLEHREFFPFGYALNQKGEIISVAAHTGEEQPPSAELIELLKGSFKASASADEYKATALCYDVRIKLNDGAEKTDAIAVALDHQDNYSVVVFRPYSFAGDILTFESLSANQGQNEIFN